MGSIIRHLLLPDKKLPGKDSPYINLITHQAVRRFLMENLFDHPDHLYETTVEDGHNKILMQLIAISYCKMRFYNLAKMQTSVLRGTNVRTSLSKLILFKQQ